MKKLATLLFCLMLVGALWAQDVELVQSNVFPNEESKIEDDYLIRPYGLKIYKGFYYVCDAQECCVKVFSASGEFVRKIGRKGQGPGELGTTFRLDIDEEDGLIYCADFGNSRIDIFDSSGHFRGIIKTLIPPRDVICFNGKIITASYNRNLNSFYTLYDSQHRIAKTFGDLFDADVPNTPDAIDLYTMASHAKEKDSFYILFEYLPYVSIYSIDGKPVDRVNIDYISVKKIYDENIVAVKKGRIDSVLRIAPWNRGGCLYKKRLYFLGDFKTDEVWAFHMTGKFLQKIPFKDKEKRPFHRLVAVHNEKFVFIDWNSGQVKVYDVVQKGG